MGRQRQLARDFTSRRQFFSSAAGATVAALALPGVFVAETRAAESRRVKVDACVYGGTSGGVVAAAALAKRGRSVVLVEPSRHLGGMTSGGLGWIDVARSEDMIGGLARGWIEALKAAYRAEGIDTRKFGNAGWVCEPHVAEALFDRWANDPNIQILRASRLASVSKDGRRLRSITLDKAPPDRRGAPAAEAAEAAYVTVEASAFIDCSYEGDLLAAAGVAWRNDREGRDEYGESGAGLVYKDWELAGPPIDPYVRPGDPTSGLIPLVSDAPAGPPGTPSRAMQSYNFRLCLTQKDPLPIDPPAEYDPKRYELVARAAAVAAQARRNPPPVKGYRTFSPLMMKINRLPRGKTDVNNDGTVSTDFYHGGSDRYATASWAERGAIWRAHEDYQRGFIHFLKTDDRIPEDVRTAVAAWGLPRDEFKETGGWPTQLYLREVRRMVGRFVVKQSDCENPSPDMFEDSVGLSVYPLDSHGCLRVVRQGRVVHEGGYMIRVKAPFPIPYRAITPKPEQCENLLATFCVSATHASFASIRMEPQHMVMSESAALAADLALSDGASVQAIDMPKLRKAMLDAGQVLEWDAA